MSVREFWYDDPWLVKAYREKNKFDIEAENEKTWLQGLYIYNAIGTCLANLFKKPTQKSASYIKEPIKLFQKKEEETRIIENERLRVYASLKNMEIQYLKKR